MLKVLINEEEVLTNKNFTIKKEMLNTPSVILNNVYPKTWEDEKDYTSNFYHPQDYSKCKIIDESIIPAEPGETISGTSFTIQDNDSTKLNELTELDGNTTQSGTPTPSSPQPINVVSGRQEITISNGTDSQSYEINLGKNLLGLQNGTYTNNGITAIVSNSEISLSGTAIANSFVTIPLNANLSLASGQYTISTNNEIANSNVRFRIESQGTLDTPLNAINKTNTITYNNETLYGNQIVVRVQSGATLSDFKFKPMLEKGSQATSYSPYKTPIELCEINDYEDMIFKGKGINLFDKDSGFRLGYINGSGTFVRGNETACFNQYIPCQPNTTYTISFSSNIYAFGSPAYYNENKVFLSRESVVNNISSRTITTPNNCYYMIMQFNVDNTTMTQEKIDAVQCQVEKGTTALPYEPYNSKGKWLLHKEIGKVVLDGSESWSMNTISNYKQFYKTFTYGTRIGYSKYFTYNNNGTVSTGNYYYYGGGNIVFVHPIYNGIDIDSIENWKTWLSTHNTIVYYVLATPTTTEITDSELISQLNSIELLEGLNNISITSANLPGIMTIHYNYNDEYTIDDLLFCGVVKNSGNISLNPREPHYLNIQILDFKTFLSEGELDSFVIYQKTILEAIQMVIANIQDYGFILGNINILNPTDIIGAYSTKDKTAYDVFNYIADITQSRWTTRLIDENHVAIDFYDPTLMIEGTPINYTQTFFEDNLIDDMTYSYGSNNYRNKQVMTSSQVYSNISQQQSIVANGYQTQFPTEQPIGKINSITSNGIPLTFATFNEKEMGYVADFYYSPGDNYFESEDLRTTGEILIIDYIAIVEGRQIITNPLEIDRINDSTGRKGIISRYEQRNDATTSTELQKIGESYIKYKGTPEIKLKISTRKNIWEVGQRVQFNAPITELNTEYMVRTKKINYISTIDTIFYEYELISSFNSETEINYFDNQRAKSSGNIGEGEYISRNIDIESTANIIFYDTETTEVQVDGDNVLNSILNSPFTS